MTTNNTIVLNSVESSLLKAALKSGEVVTAPGKKGFAAQFLLRTGMVERKATRVEREGGKVKTYSVWTITQAGRDYLSK